MTPSSRRLQEQALLRLESDPASVTFAELRRICEAVFGEGRQGKGSHLLFRTGVPDLPIVNIQPRGKMAKPYQCRQVARAAKARRARERI